jgi:hypothetical protein
LKRGTKIATAIVAAVIIIVVAGLVGYLYLSMGVLRVELTDPPVGWGEASQIYLNYSSIEVHRGDADNESGWITVIDQGGSVNLTSILNVNETLGSKSLQPGTYNLIRFQINSATVTVAEQNVSATVPSGEMQIAITQGGVTVNAGQTSTVFIQLNIAVHESDQNLMIVPNIRAVSA